MHIRITYSEVMQTGNKSSEASFLTSSDICTFATFSLFTDVDVAVVVAVVFFTAKNGALPPGPPKPKLEIPRDTIDLGLSFGSVIATGWGNNF